MRAVGADDARMDPTLRALGPLGRHQMVQVVLITLSFFPAAYQLLDNIFIGREVTSQQCTPYSNRTSSPDHGVDWNTSDVTYGKCEITVSNDNRSTEYNCLYGYDYGYSKELSFRTEFDLVCDRKLLGGLVQTVLIIGQGFGAVVCSILSDRFGRKKVLVVSELGLLVSGVAAGFSPSYPVLAVLKFVLGAFQQGVVTSATTMTIEWFPAERRAVAALLLEIFWASCAASMALIAFLLQDYTWKYLQIALSCSSILSVLHWWYLDESLRWLITNGRKEAAVKVLKRAARANRKDLNSILKTLYYPDKTGDIYTVPNGDTPNKPSGGDTEMTSPLPHEGQQDVHDDAKASPAPTSGDQLKNSTSVTEKTSQPLNDQVLQDVQKSMEGQQTRKLTILDLFRNKRLLYNSAIMWFAWFTCAFAFFALYLMSTSLHGNRFLNYFLTSVMELPPAFIIYFFVDRIGRKGVIRPLYALAGAGLLASGLLRHFAYSSVMETLSVVSAMLGMVGASGMFLGIFLYTPEMFPTNMRTQALGVASFAGRLGGMIAPFMTDLADIAVWVPGALIGTLCFGVVIVMHFLPETKGRELPDTIEDIDGWYRDQGKKDTKTFEERYAPKPEGRF